MRSKLQRIFLAAATLAVLPPVHSTERVDVERVIACADEDDDARRLACYDEAVAFSKAPANETPAPSAPVAAAVPAAAVPAANPEGDFGALGSAVARQRYSEQQQAKDEVEVDSITAVVTEVSAQPRGELVIALDNGQTWVQKRRERYFAVEPGDKVTINAGMLGSFRMSNGKRMTQVTRIK